MLQDKDRIFTNLYGLHDPGLAAARGRAAHLLAGSAGSRAPRRRFLQGIAQHGRDRYNSSPSIHIFSFWSLIAKRIINCNAVLIHQLTTQYSF